MDLSIILEAIDFHTSHKLWVIRLFDTVFKLFFYFLILKIANSGLLILSKYPFI
jgi:hypothetical protein